VPTYQRFEDLPVWQEAIKLAEGCEDFLELAEKRITWSKRDQLDRASLSVSNNIADGARQRGDGLRRRRWPGAKRRAACSGCPRGRTSRNGFERGTTNELLAFLYIARGSAGEVRSMLCFFERRPRLRDFKSQISNLKSIAESCSRQLRAWADSLQNSDIAGPRHLNAKSRADYAKRKSRASGAAKFQELLAQHLPPGHPLRKGDLKSEV
jgi:four helix bundle protein